MPKARYLALDSLQTFQAVKLLSDPGYDPSDHRVPNCAEIRFNWTNDSGVTSHNVLHGSYSGTFNGSQAQANAIHGALTTGVNWTNLAAFFATTTGFTGISIRDRNVENAPYIDSAVTSKPGTSASPALPNEVAAVITLRTAFTGPAHRGRIYIGGWATNALGAGNVIAAAAQGALGTWATIIAGAFSAQGYILCIAHPHRLAYTGTDGTQHAERPAGTVPVTIAGVRDNHWDTQRRRGLR